MKIDPTIRIEERRLAQAAPDIRAGANEQIGRMRDFGGYLKRFMARGDLYISLFDMQVQPGALSEAKSGPCLVAAVVLDGVGESRFTRIGGRSVSFALPYEAGITYLFYSPSPVSGGYSTAVAGRFRGMEVRVGLDVLKRLGGLEAFEQAADQSHPLLIARDGEAWIGAFPTPAAMRETSLRLLERSGGRLDDLAVEARALDLLTAAIAVVREPLFCQGARRIRNARQLDKVRSILLADLARAWTVREIARHVGLTEKRLKLEFRTQYGEPVYGFLQRARLEHAKALLQAGAGSVTEVAMAVGYANPSHFAKLFRRQFGIRPSALTRA